MRPTDQKSLAGRMNTACGIYPFAVAGNTQTTKPANTVI
jgi:hypothetical protein